MPITLRRKNQICVRWGEIRSGRLSATVWTQPKCRATILTGLRWRESRGCWPALQHSWNSKQQSQELKHYTQASHTPPSPSKPCSLSPFLTSLSHPASLLSEVLAFSCSSSSSSFHPSPHSLRARLPSNSSHTSLPLPAERGGEVTASFEYLNVYQPPPRWGVASCYGLTAVVVLWDHLRRVHWVSHELTWRKSMQRERKGGGIPLRFSSVVEKPLPRVGNGSMERRTRCRARRRRRRRRIPLSTLPKSSHTSMFVYVRVMLLWLQACVCVFMHEHIHCICSCVRVLLWYKYAFVLLFHSC